MRTYPDPFTRRWSRRLITYSAIFVGFVVMTIMAPVWLFAAMSVDLFRKVQMSTTRATVFVYSYFLFQVYGLTFAFFLWLGDLVLPGRRPTRLSDWMFWLEFDWGMRLGKSGINLFGMDVSVEYDYAFPSDRPVIMLVRHASITDTIVPILYCCWKYKLPYKYVMKRELEWDPCLDIAVNRMPHLFVRRGSEDSQREIDAIGQLIIDAGPRDGVVIFPEGTRYTPKKRERIIQKLRELGQDDIRAWAERYRYCLPPRMGGPLKLIENAPSDADVVICAHTGLEKSSRIADTFNGGLVGSKVRVKFWGTPVREIPVDEIGRKQWLFNEWKKVDEFIAKCASEEAAPPAASNPPSVASG